MSNFDDFLKEQMKSEEFRREYEALAPDYEFVLRGDVDPRNLCYPIKMDGAEYTEYERGYNDGVIAAYWLTRQAKAMGVEPVVHAHWIMRGGRFRCSRCDAKALWQDSGGTHGYSHEWEQVKTQYCPNPKCGAHMEEEVAE